MGNSSATTKLAPVYCQSSDVFATASGYPNTPSRLGTNAWEAASTCQLVADLPQLNTCNSVQDLGAGQYSAKQPHGFEVSTVEQHPGRGVNTTLLH